MKNSKSYWIWNHRRWAVLLLAPESPPVPSSPADSVLQRELSLCSQLLKADERNCFFSIEPSHTSVHCWGYRMFVVSRLRVDPSSELEYTTQKINQNFSNYSAWHYRSAYLTSVADGRNSEDRLRRGAICVFGPHLQSLTSFAKRSLRTHSISLLGITIGGLWNPVPSRALCSKNSVRKASIDLASAVSRSSIVFAFSRSVKCPVVECGEKHSLQLRPAIAGSDSFCSCWVCYRFRCRFKC